MEHFYDGQIRRYILQFIRMMSNFSYVTGKKSKGQSETKTFKGMAGLLECCDFVKSNMHNNITLKVQEIKELSALIDYRQS